MNAVLQSRRNIWNSGLTEDSGHSSVKLGLRRTVRAVLDVRMGAPGLQQHFGLFCLVAHAVSNQKAN